MRTEGEGAPAPSCLGKRTELAWRLEREKGSTTRCQIPSLSSFQGVGLH